MSFGYDIHQLESRRKVRNYFRGEARGPDKEMILFVPLKHFSVPCHAKDNS